MTLTAHPYADKFPMLPEGELAELAESIRSNGLRNPVVLTADGLILDGRNRAAACNIVGIEPETVTYDGDDLAEYVIDCNTTRRNMSTGARAMSTALVLAADGRRDGGRWRRGSVVGNDESVSSGSAWAQRLKECGVVLDYLPDLAPAVVAGETALDAAFKQADAIRTSAEREEILERERKKREKQEARDQAERDAQIVTDLTQAESKYLALIDGGSMTPAAAWAAHLEDTRKDREREKQLDAGRRDTCTRIAECVRFLNGGTEQAAIFLDGFYPHESRFVVEPMRLTAEAIDSAIDFLTTVRKGVTP